MTGYLLDTNLVSEAISVKPSARVLRWLGATDASLLFLSVMTIGEIRKGIGTLPPSRRRDVLEAWLDRDLKQCFGERILPITMAIAERWGVLDAKSQRSGNPLPIVDGLLAATALERDLILVTRNVRDFERLGVEVFNPWEHV